LQHLEPLSKFNPEAIEITGGGEPSLHKNIQEIIETCKSIAPTRIYTDGNLDPTKGVEICLSRAHHKPETNQQIMGTRYDIEKYDPENLKLSLMLLNSGINTKEQLQEYLAWAKQLRVKKVVVRQLALLDHPEYCKVYSQEHCRIDSPAIETEFGDFVEFDYDACDLCSDNLVLRTDGNIYPNFDATSPLTEKELEKMIE
jgi:wyosine [tRNA(Phe)-imidazoG37] synthetase (radical SAM superfamily)